MEENLNIQKSYSTSLPPGFRFYPTDHHIFSHYLIKKNNLDLSSNSTDSCLGLDVIGETDLYNYDPRDLPEALCFPFGRGGSKKHWYCFTLNLESRESAKRKAKGGVWKRKGRARDVLGGREGQVLGRKTTFEFYSTCSSRLGKTNWMLVEYALVNQKKDSYALCRVFNKTSNRKKVDEHIRNSNIGSIAATRNISTDVPYKQHDGASPSGIGEVLVREDFIAESASEKHMFPLGLTGKPDGQIISEPAPGGRIGPFLSMPPPPPPLQLDRHSGGFKSGEVVGKGSMANEILTDSTILDENYIELNDLVGPLSGIDSLG